MEKIEIKKKISLKNFLFIQRIMSKTFNYLHATNVQFFLLQPSWKIFDVPIDKRVA